MKKYRSIATQTLPNLSTSLQLSNYNSQYNDVNEYNIQIIHIIIIH